MGEKGGRKEGRKEGRRTRVATCVTFLCGVGVKVSLCVLCEFV
jgi:hypothetical protein